MKRTVKIVLIGLTLAGLLLAGCKGKEDIGATAAEIAGYSLPESYSEEFSADLLGYKVVSFKGPTPNCHIYLAQAPEGVEIDIESLKERASQESRDTSPRARDMRVVETRSVTLRGEEVPLLVSEGINSENQTYRDASALFSGRGGPALVNISSPVELWDWEMVEAFLASIE